MLGRGTGVIKRPYSGMKAGFTLMEVIVVVIIMGLLAVLALPSYIPVRERTLAREAQANLRLIAAAERIYLMEGTSFYPATAGQIVNNTADINSNLSLSLTGRNWNYWIQAYIIGGGFSAYADRRPGWGAYSNCRYMVNSTVPDNITVPPTYWCP